MPRRKRTPEPASAPAETASSQTPAPAPGALPDHDFGFAPPEHYDPAEYRWVPVRRIPRRDGWTEEKQRRFIEVLADTGLVGRAAKAVGMSREAAYKLRRAPHAAAFARAWDLARERAGAMIEDVAFERALEGVETEVYNAQGALTGSRTVYNDRLLTFLLRRLKPERYGTVDEREAARQAARDWADAGGDGNQPPPGPDSLDAALRAMEPQLPAPAEELFDPDALENDLLTAEIADGKLPAFFSEQAPVPSRQEERDAYLCELYEQGRAICESDPARYPKTAEEMSAYCLYLDPTQAKEVPRKWRKTGKPRGG